MRIDNYNFSAGQNSAISPMLRPADNLEVAETCATNLKVGSVIKDPGYERRGVNVPEANKQIRGLYYSRANSRLLATMNDSTDADTQLFYLDTADNTWKEIAAAETAWALRPSVQIDMVDFIGYTFFAGKGPSGFIPSSSLTGTTFSTSTNVTNMPKAKFVTKYRSRLYAIATEGAEYRVVFSERPQAGAIQWNPAGSFIDIDSFDPITAYGQNFDKLFLFTASETFVYDQQTLKQAWARGCNAPKTVKSTTQYFIFADSDGVWVSTGGFPQVVSGPVDDFIKGSASPDSWFAEIWGEEYWLYLGTVTIGELVYNNTVAIWDSGKNSWRVRTFPAAMTAFANERQSTGKWLLNMGGVEGKIWRKGSYYDSPLITADAVESGVGLDITASFVTGVLQVGDPMLKAKAAKAVFYGKNVRGIQVYGRWLNSNSEVVMDWDFLGELKSFMTVMELKKPIGTMIQFKFIEVSKFAPFEYYGHSIELTLDSPINGKDSKF